MKEPDQFQELQLLPTAKQMITHCLTVGLCEGNRAMWGRLHPVEAESAHSSEYRQAEIEVDCSILFIHQKKDTWSQVV